jgi:predicted SnoaL-like aldol condensation-catalyzing enzyme
MTNAANKALVSQVMDAVFVRRDSSVVERYFARAYIQHNPAIPDGRDAIPTLISHRFDVLKELVIRSCQSHTARPAQEPAI